MRIPNLELAQRARELRKNATRHENHLWYDFLRTYPVQFKRQSVIFSFIADFYCPAARLVVELDGSQHFTEDAQEYDKARTEVIEMLGIRVLRFTNDDIDRHFRDVCDTIDRAVCKTICEDHQNPTPQEKQPCRRSNESL